MSSSADMEVPDLPNSVADISDMEAPDLPNSVADIADCMEAPDIPNSVADVADMEAPDLSNSVEVLDLPNSAVMEVPDLPNTADMEAPDLPNSVEVPDLPNTADMEAPDLPNSVADIAASASSAGLPIAKKYIIPVGLENLHNTCYLNSVLQCLKFTPQVAVYCLRRPNHSTTCERRESGCTFCILEETIFSLFLTKKRVEAPKKLYDRLMANYSKHFEPGRQEDAHELLHFLIEASGEGLQEQSVFEEAFGGVMQRDIKCRSCGEVSTRCEDMLDLSLDINELSTVSEAFASFFRPEVFEEDNQYMCDGCHSLSDADVRVSIRHAPEVLTIQLKRFDPFSPKKLTHYVEIEGRLSLRDYMTTLTGGSNELPDTYELYGVIVHRGSPTYGHYYAYVKEPRGQWYKCDDEIVREVSEEQVLASNAYLLFYSQPPQRMFAIA